MPVVSQGESLGIVEAYSRLERPWTRTEINHARIISNQFGSVILALFRSPAALAAEPPSSGAGSSTCDPHLLRELAAQDVLAPLHLDEQRAPEGLGAGDPQPGPGADAALGEIAEHLGI